MTDSDINDVRSTADFKGITFSKYKKNSAKKELMQCLQSKKIESACYWGAELVCSGHLTDLWEVIIVFFGKHIHLGNPRLPIYLAMRFNDFKAVVENGYVADELRLRNSNKVRRIFAEILATLCYSNTKHSIETVKICKQDDFNMNHIACRLKAGSVDYGKIAFREADPRELYIAINELAYCIQCNNTVESCYWVEWLLEYEGLCKKRREKCECERREFVKVADKYQMEFIWIIWEILLNVAVKQGVRLRTKIIESLLSLFCIRYSPGCKKRRRYLLYCAISLLTESCDLSQEIVSNKKIIEDVVNKINIVYRDVKKKEETPATDYLNVGKSNTDKTVERLEKMNQILSIK